MLAVPMRRSLGQGEALTQIRASTRVGSGTATRCPGAPASAGGGTGIVWDRPRGAAAGSMTAAAAAACRQTGLRNFPDFMKARVQRLFCKRLRSPGFFHCRKRLDRKFPPAPKPGFLATGFHFTPIPNKTPTSSLASRPLSMEDTSPAPAPVEVRAPAAPAGPLPGAPGPARPALDAWESSKAIQGWGTALILLALASEGWGCARLRDRSRRPAPLLTCRACTACRSSRRLPCPPPSSMKRRCRRAGPLPLRERELLIFSPCSPCKDPSQAAIMLHHALPR